MSFCHYSKQTTLKRLNGWLDETFKVKMNGTHEENSISVILFKQIELFYKLKVILSIAVHHGSYSHMFCMF